MSLSLWNRSSRSKPRPAPPSRRGRPGRHALRPRLEGLESRELKTVSANLANGRLEVFSGNGDTIDLDHSGSFTFVNGRSFADSAINDIAIHAGNFFGGGNNTVNLLATVRPVTVDSAGRIDTLEVGGKAGLGMQGIQASVNLTGFNEDAELIFDDSANPFSRFATLSEVPFTATLAGLAPGTITFLDTGFTQLRIKGGSGGNTFNILDTPHQGFIHFTNTTLISGNGNDTVNVFGSSSSYLHILGLNGQDTVNLGAGSLQSILSDTTIHNNGGRIALTVNDSANTFGKNVTMGVGPLEVFHEINGLLPGTAVLEYEDRDLSSLTIHAGRGGNTFTIDDTFDNGAFDNTILNTGTGTDTVNVRGTTGKLFINGQAGADTVNVGNAGFLQGIRGEMFITNLSSRSALNVSDASGAVARTVVLDHSAGTGTIAGLAPLPIQYTSNDVRSVNLTGSGRDDLFFVRSTPDANTAVPVTVNGGAGSDLFVVGSAGNTLDRIRGTLTVHGGIDFDTLVVNDQGSTTPHTYTQTASSVLRSGAAPIIFFSIEGGPQVNKGPVASLIAFTDRTVTAGAAGLVTVTGRIVQPDPEATFTLRVDWGDGSAPESFAFPAGSGGRVVQVAHRYAKDGTYPIRLEWFGPTGPSNGWTEQAVVTNAAPAPATIESITVGDGSPQRSTIRSLTVAFSTVVAIDPGAFTLHRDGGGQVDVLVSTAVVGGKTVATLTFAGKKAPGGMLADGRYTLKVKAGKVRDAAGRALDGDGDGQAGGSRSYRFSRLAGDHDGDGRVEGLKSGRGLRKS